MGLRDVKELVEALHGLPDDLHLGKRAGFLTIGDLRMLLRCAMLMDAEYMGPPSVILSEPPTLRRAD